MSTETPIPGYETVFVTRPEMAEDALKQLQERLMSIAPQFKGQMIMNEDWGRKKLAYPIQNETRGRFTYLVYTGTGEVVAEVERNLRLSDQVLRFISVRLAQEFNETDFQKRREDVKAQIKRRAEEREARREERAAHHAGGSSDYESRHDSSRFE